MNCGQRCLLDANSELGISLGDDCVIEAGIFLTASVCVHIPVGHDQKSGLEQAVGREADA